MYLRFSSWYVVLIAYDREQLLSDCPRVFVRSVLQEKLSVSVCFQDPNLKYLG